MSTRTNSKHKTSTSKIINMLEEKEYSFQELAKNLHEDEETLSRELNQLVRDDVVALRFHNHHVTYVRIHYPQAVRLMRSIEDRMK